MTRVLIADDHPLVREGLRHVLQSTSGFVVAGEASGDLHGARLLTELRRLEPGLEAFGLGGGELRAAGLETVADSSEVAVVGVVEVLKVLPPGPL